MSNLKEKVLDLIEKHGNKVFFECKTSEEWEDVQKIINLEFYEDTSLYKDEYAWMDTINKVLQKKYGGTTPPTAKDKAKWVRFLTYRGFEYEQIERAFRNASDLS